MSSEHPGEQLRERYASGWLQREAPELHQLYGVPQNASHHPEVDTGVHIELALEVAATLSPDPRVRYATLVHDLGKGLTPSQEWPKHLDHERKGVRPGLRLGRRMGVPREWRRLGALVARHHLRAHRALEASPKRLVRLLLDAGFVANPELLEPFVLACEADARGRAGLQSRPYPQAQRLRKVLTWVLEVSVDNPVRLHQARVEHVALALAQDSTP